MPAGVYVSAGGLESQPASIVATDGAVTDGPYPEAVGEAIGELARAPADTSAILHLTC